MPYVLTCDLCGDVLVIEQDTKKPYAKIAIPASSVRERYPQGTSLYVCNDCIEEKLLDARDTVSEDLATDLQPHMDGTGIPHD